MKKRISPVIVVLVLLLCAFCPAFAEEPAATVVHTVVAGDTLWRLAQTYVGDGMAWTEIWTANNDAAAHNSLFTYIADPDVIEPGWSVVISAAGVPWPAANHSVTEIDVAFENLGQTIVGTLALPKGVEAPPVVLLFHGFTGQRHELPVSDTGEGIFSRAARILAEQGYASLRIDFRGSGESEGEWADTTFSGQIADAIAAVDYASNMATVDSSRIGIVGFSQGGLVASATAAADPRVTTVVLWSPVSNPPLTYGSILGWETISAGLAATTEVVTATLPWGVETGLRRPFYEDLFRVDPIGEIASYGGALMVIVGLNDTLVAPQPQEGELYLSYHPGKEALVELVTDHMFDCFAGTTMVDQAIYWSLSWFDANL